jgi:hypothetical protein
VTYALSTTLHTAFEDAVERTRKALADQGFGVLTEIDVKATPAGLGADDPHLPVVPLAPAGRQDSDQGGREVDRRRDGTPPSHGNHGEIRSRYQPGSYR